MARILLSSFGSYGDVHPVVGIALALRRRGHEPVLALPEYYRADVERHGLELRPVRPDVDLGDRETLARVMRPRTGTAFLFQRLLVPALRDSYDDLLAAAGDVDLVVTHPAVPAGPIVAEVRGLPWVSMVLAPLSLFSAHDPMVPPPAPRAHALTSRSRPLAALALWVADRMTRRWARPIRALRVEQGLAPGGNPVMAGQHSPHAVLALFSRVLAEPQPDWPERVRVTGAVLHNGRAGSPAMPPELERFLQAADPPLVFTLGSSAVGVAGRFYHEAAAAARRMGRRAVLLVGHQPGTPHDASATDDIIAAAWADHAALFPRAAGIVHHGGAGTLHQALRAGRPQLVVPHSHDQPDNAMRAARLGVARVLLPTRFRARRVAGELERLLAEPGFARRAAEAAAVVRGERGADTACDAIDGVLAAESA